MQISSKKGNSVNFTIRIVNDVHPLFANLESSWPEFTIVECFKNWLLHATIHLQLEFFQDF